MIDFTNTQIAFESKNDRDLQRARLLFEAIRSPFMVKCCKVASLTALKIHFPVAWAVKPTIYRHFVGGETLEDCTQLSKELMKYGVYSILDYSAEGGNKDSDIMHTFTEILHSIDYAMGNRNIAYAVFKPTALTHEESLRKYSEGEELTQKESEDIEHWKECFEALCKRAFDADVRLLVDAEDVCFQDAIDKFTDEMMRKYNSKRAIVFTTFQMYRHDRYAYLERLYNDAVENNYIVGMKFVRGAYMEEERLRAQKMGYPDPICATKEDTDNNYNAGLKFVIEHIDHFELFSGSHNEESNRYLASIMKEHGIANDDKRVFFAQLYGMSDNISYNLAKDGYNVVKYIPYAPVNKVLPYLIRRAEENTAMVGQSTRELNMIRSEIMRRKQVN